MNKNVGPQPLPDGAAPKPIDSVLARLSDVRPLGKGHVARCPAHDDRTPSLSITEGHDGRVLLNCFARCTNEAIVSALGLTMSDLFLKAGDNGRAPRRSPGRQIVETYDYKDEGDALLFQVVRYEPKDFRQRCPDGKGGWLWNLSGVRRVLYQLPKLLVAPAETWVFIVEGEKDADRLAVAGLIATTNPGGASKWKAADDTSLHGRRVCVLCDNDEAGRRHRDEVARRLYGAAADLRLVDLPGVPPKGDVSDWFDAGHTVTELLSLVYAAGSVQIVPVALDEMAAKASHSADREPPIPFGHYDVPTFPLEAIPERLCALREFCAAVAESLQVPRDSVVLLALAAAGAALAKRIKVQVCPDWWEPVNLFVVVAMESGERKSALFRKVARPLVDYEREQNDLLAPLIEQNKAELSTLQAELKYQQGRAAKAKKSEDRAATRQRVKELTEEIRTTKIILPLQLIADDATPEAVGQLLHEQEGRIALMSPEGDVFDLMAGRYSDGVSRLGVYLKGHAGDDYKLNRITRANECVQRPALTVGLAVQPEVLRGLMEKPGFRGRGLLARFVYSLPASLVGFRKLNPQSVPSNILVGYTKLIYAALELQPAVDAKGDPCPFVVRVSSEALTELDRFRAWAEPELRHGGELSAIRDWGSKLPGAVCRIAGIFHGLVHSPTGNPAAQPIDVETMLCAITLGEYTVEHAKAAFCEMGSDPATARARRVLAWFTEAGLTQFTRRDAFNTLRGTVRRVEGLDEPLQLLIEHGYIRERAVERKGPGRKPSTLYEVNPQVRPHNTHNAQNGPPAVESAQSA